MKKIYLTILSLTLALGAMAQSASSGMQHRVGVSVGLGAGSLRQQYYSSVEGVQVKFGVQDMLEADYLFLSQPLGSKQMVRLGARVGLGIDMVHNSVSADRVSSAYSLIDYEGRQVDYTTEVRGINEKNSLYCMALPIQFVLRMENGLYVAAGVRALFPVSGTYRHTTTTNDVVAYFPALDVHEPNQVITGQMPQGYSANGHLKVPGPMCNVDMEVGYEWDINSRHFLRLSAYGSIPTGGVVAPDVFCSNDKGILYTDGPKSSGAQMYTASLMNANGMKIANLSFGLRFAYSFNLTK